MLDSSARGVFGETSAGLALGNLSLSEAHIQTTN